MDGGWIDGLLVYLNWNLHRQDVTGKKKEE